MSQSTVSYLWREPQAPHGFSHGVSLHSHTNQSKETLDFIAELSTDLPFLQPIIRWGEDRCLRFYGMRPDYTRSFWTPPLTPKAAFDLESRQIEDSLQLSALVSISDHDNIGAANLLRALPSAPELPISVEWTVPYLAAALDHKPTAFHMGIHNLPPETAAEWIERMNAFTDMPVESRSPQLLLDMFAELARIPGVLIVFNHPLWDLYRIGKERHGVLVNDMLATAGQFIHALELNGLRHWDENREVRALAARWNQLVLSGGDRHGIEPNANVNLTRATCFAEFVSEIRRDKISNVLFMPQYRQPWKHRILQSTLDAIRNHPQFAQGHQRWDERTFSPDIHGDLRPLSELWIAGRPPFWISAVVASVRLLGQGPVSGSLKWAWNDSAAMRIALKM